jgi:PHD/YefM family antitoxin component YafN of YafNO toxin-antitoxin module
MFPNQLKKILKLIKKTGDRVVIYNENEPEDSVVLMGLENYEELVSGDTDNKKQLKIANPPDLTSDDITDRINCDISAWKNQENGQYLAEESKSRNPWAIPAKIKSGAQKIE